MSCDPIKRLDSAFTMNPYVYCGDNPIVFKDPTGLRAAPGPSWGDDDPGGGPAPDVFNDDLDYWDEYYNAEWGQGPFNVIAGGNKADDSFGGTGMGANGSETGGYGAGQRGAGTVPVVVPPGRAGDHLGRTTGVSQGLSRAGGPPAANFGRGAQPDAPGGPRPGSLAGDRTGLCRTGVVAG